MARNTTLVRLLDMYRAECRMSFNPAHNNQDQQRQIRDLQKTQEYLWEDYDWPLLRVERTINLQAGQRYYAMPDDLHIDRISKVEVFHDTAYCALQAGIDAVHYTAYNSDLDERQFAQRGARARIGARARAPHHRPDWFDGRRHARPL